MNYVNPKVEWWQQKSLVSQIAKVGRICYKSAPKPPQNQAMMSLTEVREYYDEQDAKLCNRLWESGHRSMFRHGTVYYFIKNEHKMPNQIWALLVASPYIEYTVQDHKVWVATNMQFFNEHARLLNLMESFHVSEEEFIRKAVEYKCEPALWLLRMTFVVTTQISTSRELNRTSPNCISEQSTRYVNMAKKGGVQIAIPHWLDDATKWQRFLFKASCKFSEWAYLRLLNSGILAQDARGVLPLDTYTVVAYTYSLSEWDHMLQLRYYEKTGKAHQNAKIVATQIHDIIQDRMAAIWDGFQI